MSDPFSIDNKREEVEEVFTSVGFVFQGFDLKLLKQHVKSYKKKRA